MLKPNFKDYTEKDYSMLLDVLLSTQGVLFETCDANCNICQHKRCCNDIDELLYTVSRAIAAREQADILSKRWKKEKEIMNL